MILCYYFSKICNFKYNKLSCTIHEKEIKGILPEDPNRSFVLYNSLKNRKHVDARVRVSVIHQAAAHRPLVG